MQTKKSLRMRDSVACSRSQGRAENDQKSALSAMAVPSAANMARYCLPVSNSCFLLCLSLTSRVQVARLLAATHHCPPHQPGKHCVSPALPNFSPARLALCPVCICPSHLESMVLNIQSSENHCSECQQIFSPALVLETALPECPGKKHSSRHQMVWHHFH